MIYHLQPSLVLNIVLRCAIRSTLREFYLGGAVEAGSSYVLFPDCLYAIKLVASQVDAKILRQAYFYPPKSLPFLSSSSLINCLSTHTRTLFHCPAECLHDFPTMHVLKDTEENAHQLEVRSEGVLEVWTKKAVPGINVATSKATTINAALWHATLVTLKPT